MVFFDIFALAKNTFTMRYKLILSYDGSAFSGWQIQPDSPTVQEDLQKALSTLTREEVTVTGAGRTDSKVNAVTYAAHFDAPALRLDANDFVYKLNAILPHGIVVHSVSATAPDFHARFGARLREYKYFVHRKKDPFVSRYSWFCYYKLDVGKMNEAAELILGKRDFKCFEKTGTDNRTSVCDVSYARWETYSPTHVSMMGYPSEEGDYLVFTIRADRFLRNMVRAVVGTLVEVGRGRRDLSWVKDLIENGTRSDAGESVPGHALFLSDVKYEE